MSEGQFNLTDRAIEAIVAANPVKIAAAWPTPMSVDTIRRWMRERRIAGNYEHLMTLAKLINVPPHEIVPGIYEGYAHIASYVTNVPDGAARGSDA